MILSHKHDTRMLTKLKGKQIKADKYFAYRNVDRKYENDSKKIEEARLYYNVSQLLDEKRLEQNDKKLYEQEKYHKHENTNIEKHKHIYKHIHKQEHKQEHKHKQDQDRGRKRTFKPRRNMGFKYVKSHSHETYQKPKNSNKDNDGDEDIISVMYGKTSYSNEDLKRKYNDDYEHITNKFIEFPNGRICRNNKPKYYEKYRFVEYKYRWKSPTKKRKYSNTGTNKSGKVGSCCFCYQKWLKKAYEKSLINSDLRIYNTHIIGRNSYEGIRYYLCVDYRSCIRNSGSLF